jgi:thioredoxin 1
VTTELTADTFDKEVLQADRPVLVDFWGPQCVPCLRLLPRVEALADKHAAWLKVAKVNAAQNRRLCLKLKVLSLPTFLVFNSGEEVGRLTGQQLTIKDIEAEVQHFAPAAESAQ